MLRIKLVAANVMGSTESPALQFVLAAIPPKPTPAPAVVSSGTSTDAI